MKWLLLVRHGVWDKKGTRMLKPEGQNQIRWVAEKINSLIGVARVSLLSSPATPAVETMSIIGSRIGFESEETNICFFSTDGRLSPSVVEEAIQVIDERGRNHDVVIVSTHAEFLKLFPTIWGARHGFTIPEAPGMLNGWTRAINANDGAETLLTPE